MNVDNTFSDNLAVFLSKRNYATGQWRGYRQKFEDNGIIFKVDYTSDMFSNVAGGIESNSVHLDNIDITSMTKWLKEFRSSSGSY